MNTNILNKKNTEEGHGPPNFTETEWNSDVF